MRFVTSALFLLTLLPLSVFSQVTNLTVNGSTTDFTMTSGDTVSWSFSIPAGEAATATIWHDVNGNHTVEPGTDRVFFQFLQRDGDPNGQGGPPDFDGVENGEVVFFEAVGLAPASYILEFSHNGSGQSVWGTVLPLLSPAFTVSGTVSGPPGADVGHILINADSDGGASVSFWVAMTDSFGDYTIAMGPDTTGNPWTISLENPPRPYTVNRRDTLVTITGHHSGVHFTLVAAAAQVRGRIRDDAGDSLAFSEISLQRIDTAGSHVSYYQQSDGVGEFWFGVPLGDLNGSHWRLVQARFHAPPTTHLLATAEVGALGNGDSVVRNLTAYRINSTIEGYLQIDGNPPGFPVQFSAFSPDSGEGWTVTDSATGWFSIGVSDLISSYELRPNNVPGSYSWPMVNASPGDTGVIYNLTTTSVGGGGGPGASPSSFALHPNYPNPFNPSTVIGYTLPARTHVRLTVYDLLGRAVATPVDAVQEPGDHRVRFDAAGLPAGVYVYRLVAGASTASRSMLLLK